MDLDLIARTTVILLVACTLAAALRRAAPSTRHLVWQLAILGVLLAPMLITLAPNIQIPIAIATTVPEAPTVPPGLVPGAPVPMQPIFEQNQTSGTFGTLGTLGTLGSSAVLFWFGLCWLLSGLSVWRGSRPAPEAWVNDARMIGRRLGLRRAIQVRQSIRETTPHVAGLLASAVILPPSAMAWTTEARHAVLVHELTHIQRGDRRTLALAQLACALYWFNPLVWYAAAGLARERERACDEAVLRFGARPSAYASLLLDLARRSGAGWMPATALSMARPSALEGRLLAILTSASRAPRRSTRWLAGLASLTLTTAILGAQPATAPPAVPAAAQPKPEPLVDPALVMALDDQVSSSITSALVAALRDADRQVREQAAIGLAITPGAEVIDPLLGALTDSDAQVREKAAIGLAFRRDPKIVEPLLRALEDPDAQVREKAAIALGASGDRRAIGALTAAMKDPDSQVREKAAAALVLLGLRRPS
jgi:bla regulator protein blaR1